MSHLKFKDAITYWSSAMNGLSLSVRDCGMAKELSYLHQEANLLGFGNVTILQEGAEVLLHGADIYPELADAHKAFLAGDYRTVGAELGRVMKTLAQWTEDYACNDPWCYITTGIMQYIGSFEGDLKECLYDFEYSFSNFSHGFGQMHGHGIGGDFHFNTNVNELIQGVRYFGVAMKDVAQGVGKCHLGELALILGKLGNKMTLTPVIGWLEELLHILIEGQHIEQEIVDACVAWGSHNYPGFGFNLARLVKTLL